MLDSAARLMVLYDVLQHIMAVKCCPQCLQAVQEMIDAERQHGEARKLLQQ